MVEQEAVNFKAAGSSPVPGAMKNNSPFGGLFFIIYGLDASQFTGSANEEHSKNVKVYFHILRAPQEGAFVI